MRTRIIMITLIAVMVTAGFAFAAEKPETPKKPAGTKASELKTEMDKVSYIIGNNIGTNFKQSGLDNLSYDAFIKGIKDAMGGKEAALNQMETQMIMQAFSMKMREKMMAEQQKKIDEENVEIGKKNLAEGKAFLAENAKKKGVVTLPSGLQYKIIKKGTGPKLTKTDIFKALYTGKFIDGEVFDSTAKRNNKPLEMPVTDVIPGWIEALQLMPIGSKWEIYIPQDLAYANKRPGKMYKATLIFEMELLGKGEPPKPRMPMPRPGGAGGPK